MELTSLTITILENDGYFALASESIQPGGRVWFSNVKDITITPEFHDCPFTKGCTFQIPPDGGALPPQGVKRTISSGLVTDTKPTRDFTFTFSSGPDAPPGKLIIRVDSNQGVENLGFNYLGGETSQVSEAALRIYHRRPKKIAFIFHNKTGTTQDILINKIIENPQLNLILEVSIPPNEVVTIPDAVFVDESSTLMVSLDTNAREGLEESGGTNHIEIIVDPDLPIG